MVASRLSSSQCNEGQTPNASLCDLTCGVQQTSDVLRLVAHIEEHVGALRCNLLAQCRGHDAQDLRESTERYQNYLSRCGPSWGR